MSDNAVTVTAAVNGEGPSGIEGPALAIEEDEGGDPAPGRAPARDVVVHIKQAVQVMHIAWGAAWFIGFGLVLRGAAGAEPAPVSAPAPAAAV